MKQKFVPVVFFLCISVLIYSQSIAIKRNNTILKDGPGSYFTNLVVLNSGVVVTQIGPSKDDSGWIEVVYNKTKGFVPKLAFQAVTGNNYGDLLSGTDFSSKKQTIASTSYTAAIKGFALEYAVKKGIKINLDDIYAITEFKSTDLIKFQKEAKLAYFPKEGEYIGDSKRVMNPSLEAVGLSISLSVLSNGYIPDVNMTRKLNVIANILNRQTFDYDRRLYVWIINDPEPVAYSGPGGYIFVSDSLLKLLSDNRELVAVIAHEIGHIAKRHGIKDLNFDIAKQSAQSQFDELDDLTLTDEEKSVSQDLDSIMDEATKACALVRDDIQEFEADEVAMELLRRYKIDNSYLKKALSKVYTATSTNAQPQYKEQTQKRLARIK